MPMVGTKLKIAEGHEPVLLDLVGVEDAHTLKVAEEHGRYKAMEQALKMDPKDVRETVKEAGLRGRGGAGFPTGLKWSFINYDRDVPHYLVNNMDESEPGTFKDRALATHDPHRQIEGMVIAAHAIQAHWGVIYIRGEFTHEYAILDRAIQEAYDAGRLGKDIAGSGFDFDLVVTRGAGAYICGEETGLLASLEGKRGYPYVKPPFPTDRGAFGVPCVVNNSETLACVPLIIERGADWFQSMGTEKGPGPKLYCLSGHMEWTGIVEGPLGMNLRGLIENEGEGCWKGRSIKGVIPGGGSACPLRPDELDVQADFDSLQAAGTMLGSAGITVMDETVCMVDMSLNALRFFHHESCGQCTPCREGTGWLEKIMHRLERGRGSEADFDKLLSICGRMQGKTICALADAAVMPTVGFVEKYRDEFEQHLREKGCPVAKEHEAAAAPVGAGS